MNVRTWRPYLSILVLLATVTFFVYFFVKHPVVRAQLEHTSPAALGLLLLIYLGTVVALAMINDATLRLCKVELGASESLLLTAYSSIINFFGPLQSGPAFRAVYLKKKYGLNLKNYTIATFMYYFFFACFSGLFLLSSILKGWLIVLALAGLFLALLARQNSWVKARLQALDLRSWYYLALATFLQVGLVALIYYIELKNVAPGTHFTQSLVYTGAANLALFVSLTPGAIGFREAFLLFSQRLHHISSSTIVAANIVDRAMYISLLLILALFIFGTHAQRQFKVRQN
ncbi:MAG TPA: lysylphosphatidylglycerol synthase domain-containing protein [Verrucomicrobiae bacterium]|nr:lysylphosphatidylglycerol synthase domain-containing protein [Verrucomicrobiae bacterium]